MQFRVQRRFELATNVGTMYVCVKIVYLPFL